MHITQNIYMHYFELPSVPLVYYISATKGESLTNVEQYERCLLEGSEVLARPWIDFQAYKQ
jgi:hypothetical protein